MLLVLCIKIPWFLVFLIFEMFRAKERTHGQARSLVCCGCGCKDFKSKAITNSLEEVVRQEISPVYSRDNTYHPNGLCGSCRTFLFAAKRGDPVPTTVRDKWNSMDFDAYRPPSRSSPCSCRICMLVRHKGDNLEPKSRLDVHRVVPDYDENQA